MCIRDRPKVYRRTGDTRIYDDTLIDIRSDGIYRSLHYIIKYRGYYVEIQARTLFEEVWSCLLYTSIWFLSVKK